MKITKFIHFIFNCYGLTPARTYLFGTGRPYARPNVPFRYGLALCLMSFALLLSSCSLIQPPDTVPSYIRVQSYSDSTPIQDRSSNVTDIWVDANSNFIGMFQIPVSVPILKTGPTTISLQAMVQEDGVVSNLLPYPFYTIYKTTVDLKPGVLDTIKPFFKYNTSNTTFAMPEGNFEGNNPLKATGENTANVYVTSKKDSVFQGLKSYEADFSTGHEILYVYNYNALTPPTSYVVWLEMNYKTDVPIDVGILSVPSPTSGKNIVEEFVSGVNPTSTWKKVYINLGPALQYYNQNPHFQVYLKAVASGNARVLIDNLKVLYLE